MSPPPVPRHPAALATLAALVLAAAPMTASAQTWAEYEDAGDLATTANQTYGVGTLTAITGSLANDADVDMYCIVVTDPVNFAAWLNCAALNENDLWIFAPSELGVARDRGCQGGQTRVGAPIVTTAGYYYAAVSGNDASARNGGSDIWQPGVPFTGQVAPNGPAAGLWLTGWNGGVVNPVAYTIHLVGASYCVGPLPARTRSWGATKLIYR